MQVDEATMFRYSKTLDVQDMHTWISVTAPSSWTAYRKNRVAFLGTNFNLKIVDRQARLAQVVGVCENQSPKSPLHPAIWSASELSATRPNRVGGVARNFKAERRANTTAIRKPAPPLLLFVDCLLGIPPARILRLGILFSLAYGIALILKDMIVQYASDKWAALGTSAVYCTR